jgi:hypothetical protein
MDPELTATKARITILDPEGGISVNVTVDADTV